MTPIDLRSDTVTRPSPEMRRAMAEAEVGDDERDGDPTTLRLERRVAELLGKDRALFFPSGVMANQAAVNLHARPGTEIILDEDAHIIHWEMAGAAALSGAQIRPVRPTGLVATADDMRRYVRPAARHVTRASLVCVENTHNGAGGKVIPLREMQAIRAFAAEQGVPVHLDGARLWNASVASGVASLGVASGWASSPPSAPESAARASESTLASRPPSNGASGPTEVSAPASSVVATSKVPPEHPASARTHALAALLTIASRRTT